MSTTFALQQHPPPDYMRYHVFQLSENSARACLWPLQPTNLLHPIAFIPCFAMEKALHSCQLYLARRSPEWRFRVFTQTLCSRGCMLTLHPPRSTLHLAPSTLTLHSRRSPFILHARSSSNLGAHPPPFDTTPPPHTSRSSSSPRSTPDIGGSG